MAIRNIVSITTKITMINALKSMPLGYGIAIAFVMPFMLLLLGRHIHLALTWSLRYAPSSITAPLKYMEIPIAEFIEWLIFQDMPNSMATLGIAIIMVDGL